MRLISLMVAIVLPKAVKRGTDVDLTPVTENACRQPLLRSFEKILAELKPEAAYFTATEHGERGGFIVFDLKDTSQIPAIVEPFFLMYNARLKISPVMNAQDLAAAQPGIDRAVKAYGG